MLQKYNTDISALSETRLAGSSQPEEVGGGYTFFWIGRSKEAPCLSGVGFAIKSELAKSLSSLPTGVTDRIMMLSLHLENNSSVTLVSCYAPTMSNPEQEKDYFYEQLCTVILKLQHKDKLVLMGNFNARVGADHQTWPGVLDPHGVGQMNSNGLHLLSLCREFDLAITNTFHQQTSNRKTTWMHPRSKNWHMIDYVITKQRDVKDFNITRSFHSTCYLSDYALLCSKASFSITQKKHITKSLIPKRINVLPFKSSHKKRELSNQLESSLDLVQITDDIESSWKSCRDTTYKISLEVLGLPVQKHQDWFDDNTYQKDA